MGFFDKSIMLAVSPQEVAFAYSDYLLRVGELRAKVDECSRLASIFGGVRNLPDVDVEDFALEAKRSVWQFLADTTQVDLLMSEEKRENLRKQMDTAKDMPEPTYENVVKTLESWRNELNTYFEESVGEVFLWLAPRINKTEWDKKYKSHHGNKIGEKAIIRYVARGGCGLNHTWQTRLNQVERIFRILDGKRLITDRYCLGFNLDQLLWKDPPPVEYNDEYFRIKVFKNCNGHIWFKRMDLVEQINATVGGAVPDILASSTGKGR